jgi:hypothetical protein
MAERLSNMKHTYPLPDRLKDTELFYQHIRLGLMLCGGSDLNHMDRQVKKAESGLSKEDRLLLRANWRLVRARLVAEGYV